MHETYVLKQHICLMDLQDSGADHTLQHLLITFTPTLNCVPQTLSYLPRCHPADSRMLLNRSVTAVLRLPLTFSRRCTAQSTLRTRDTTRGSPSRRLRDRTTLAHDETMDPP